jgi:hypothetical protein
MNPFRGASTQMTPVGLRPSAALFPTRLVEGERLDPHARGRRGDAPRVPYRSLDRLPNNRAIPRFGKAVEPDPNRPRDPDGARRTASVPLRTRTLNPRPSSCDLRA